MPLGKTLRGQMMLAVPFYSSISYNEENVLWHWSLLQAAVAAEVSRVGHLARGEVLQQLLLLLPVVRRLVKLFHEPVPVDVAGVGVVASMLASFVIDKL